MKTAICYASVHHKNTEELVKCMAEAGNIDLIDLQKDPNPDLSKYHLIGFASGAYHRHMHETVENLIRKTAFTSKQHVFTVVTCGVACTDYAKTVKDELKERNVHIAGCFQCRGYDTYGPFGMIGGIAKNRPNDRDKHRAVNFMSKLLQIKAEY